MLNEVFFLILIQTLASCTINITNPLPSDPKVPIKPKPIVKSKCESLSVGQNPPLKDFKAFPEGSFWEKDISLAPVDKMSDIIIKGDPSNPNKPGLSTNRLHPDFGNSDFNSYGIPYNVVDSVYSDLLPIVVDKSHGYPEESDISFLPLSDNLVIESKPLDCVDEWKDDNHLIIIDKRTCYAYEAYQAHRCNGLWSFSSTAFWDLNKQNERPFGWTSVDAAGLSVLSGLIRYDEIESGSINHAIRFTLNHTKTGPHGSFFVYPATHGAGGNWGTDNIMGMRLRLKSNYDISSFSPTNQIILKAMKKYGLILADNGSNMYFQGAPSPKWNDLDLSDLGKVRAFDFEVIDMGSVYTANDQPVGLSPKIIEFSSSDVLVNKGSVVKLKINVQDSSYNYIDKLGVINESELSTTINEKTEFELISTNKFGRSTQSLTIEVK